jgi:hypothetical protein
MKTLYGWTPLEVTSFCKPSISTDVAELDWLPSNLGFTRVIIAADGIYLLGC